MRGFCISLIVCFIAAGPVNASVIISIHGDDDGFGSGTPLVPGNLVWTWPPGPADPDGFDGYGIGTAADPDFVWTHSFAPFTSITAANLYLQLLDFPESGAGQIWIDGVKTAKVIPGVPLNQGAPWIVYGNTIDLAGYFGSLLDGFVTFGFSAAIDDAWSIDYARLTIEGTLAPTQPNPIPVPGAALLATLGAGLVGWLRRRGLC